MSFQDIEGGSNQTFNSSLRDAPQSREETAFLNLQMSISIQVFKINANVQGILKLVDQLGTPRDSSILRKGLYVSPHSLTIECQFNWSPRFSRRHDLTETTRAMTKRGSDDLKKLAALQATLVRPGSHTPPIGARS
jgi:hypothetical protein